jgi:hypothetical protein
VRRLTAIATVMVIMSMCVGVLVCVGVCVGVCWCVCWCVLVCVGVCWCRERMTLKDAREVEDCRGSGLELLLEFFVDPRPNTAVPSGVPGISRVRGVA